MNLCIGISGRSHSGKDVVSKKVTDLLNNKFDKKFIYVNGGIFYRSIAKYVSENIFSLENLTNLDINYDYKKNIISINDDIFTLEDISSEGIGKIASDYVKDYTFSSYVDKKILNFLEESSQKITPIIASRSIHSLLQQSELLNHGSLRVFLDVSKSSLEKRVNSSDNIEKIILRDAQDILSNRLYIPSLKERKSLSEYKQGNFSLKNDFIYINTDNLTIKKVTKLIANIIKEISGVAGI